MDCRVVCVRRMGPLTRKKILGFYDLAYLRLFAYAKYQWGSDSAAPFVAACMLTNFAIVYAITIAAMANLFDPGWKLSKYPMIGLGVIFVVIIAFNIIRYGTPGKAARIADLMNNDLGRFTRHIDCFLILSLIVSVIIVLISASA